MFRIPDMLKNIALQDFGGALSVEHVKPARGRSSAWKLNLGDQTIFTFHPATGVVWWDLAWEFGEPDHQASQRVSHNAHHALADLISMCRRFGQEVHEPNMFTENMRIVQ